MNKRQNCPFIRGQVLGEGSGNWLREACALWVGRPDGQGECAFWVMALALTTLGHDTHQMLSPFIKSDEKRL